MAEITPAEELRTAAAKLREAAKDTTPDRWKLLTYQIVASFDHDCEQITEIATTGGHTPNARWIALANPLLAEPLAAWLDWAAGIARDHPWDPDYQGMPSFRWCTECQDEETNCVAVVDRALAVARVINGGDRS